VQFETACSAEEIGGISNEDALRFPSENNLKLHNEIK
jgi:hypothetical protein